MNERTIFTAALGIENPSQRAAYLDQACAGDPKLRRAVESLLQAHDEAGSFLQWPPAAPHSLETISLEGSKPVAGTRSAREPATAPMLDAEGEDDWVADLFGAPGDAGQPMTIGPYLVTELIGRGGMGVVLKALDQRLQRTVAVKVLAPELASSPAARRRFLREAQAAAAVSHDHVVTIHAVDQWSSGQGGCVPRRSLPYLVMEYVAGQSLQQRIDNTGPLELREILRYGIGRQVALGLAAAHEQGLIHTGKMNGPSCSGKGKVSNNPFAK